MDVRAFYLADEVRDRYFLAMAHFKLSQERAEQAREEFEKAEALYPRERAGLYDYWDILERVRNKAKEVLGK